MNLEITNIIIIFVQALLGFASIGCFPESPYMSEETVVRESPKISITCELQAVSGTDVPKKEYSYSPLPTQTYYAGTASSPSTSPSPSPSLENTRG